MKNLKKQDIRRIGGTVYGDTMGASFICDPKTSNIEYLLLCELLPLFGDYSIISEDDYMWGNGSMEWEIKTNLPWNLYMEFSQR